MNASSSADKQDAADLIQVPRGGRPRKGVPRQVRIPADLDAWLTEETARTGKTRTDLVSEGVRRLRDALRS